MFSWEIPNAGNENVQLATENYRSIMESNEVFNSSMIRAGGNFLQNAASKSGSGSWSLRSRIPNVVGNVVGLSRYV